MSDPTVPVAFTIDRSASLPLTDQLSAAIRDAILDGRLGPGARLPSGRDLAAQLGLARGTVRAAYERLVDESLLFSAGAAGTRVAHHVAVRPEPTPITFERPLAALRHTFSARPLPFEMGVPANDAFPAKVWAKLRTRAVRQDALAPTAYPDPRGEPELRAEIARHLGISRRLACVADQVIVTSGYRHGLGLILQALDVRGRQAWFEEPGFSLSRRALEIAGLAIEPIAVDRHGLIVEQGTTRAPDAALAVVTPGQHAPYGFTMSQARRLELIAWAETRHAWVIEDDYLSELQLDGRTAPALASGAGARRVIHVGSFSKTLSPSLGLGFVVPPAGLVDRMTEVSAAMAPAPNRTTQLALADFMADGHFLRHLRLMKALYVKRRALLRDMLSSLPFAPAMAGTAMLLQLPDTTDDVALADRALRHGIAPAALSPWFARLDGRRRGLLLSATNIAEDNVEAACGKLHRLLSDG